MNDNSLPVFLWQRWRLEQTCAVKCEICCTEVRDFNQHMRTAHPGCGSGCSFLLLLFLCCWYFFLVHPPPASISPAGASHSSLICPIVSYSIPPAPISWSLSRADIGNHDVLHTSLDYENSVTSNQYSSAYFPLCFSTHDYNLFILPLLVLCPINAKTAA